MATYPGSYIVEKHPARASHRGCLRAGSSCHTTMPCVYRVAWELHSYATHVERLGKRHLRTIQGPQGHWHGSLGSSQSTFPAHPGSRRRNAQHALQTGAARRVQQVCMDFLYVGLGGWTGHRQPTQEASGEAPSMHFTQGLRAECTSYTATPCV